MQNFDKEIFSSLQKKFLQQFLCSYKDKLQFLLVKTFELPIQS